MAGALVLCPQPLLGAEETFWDLPIPLQGMPPPERLPPADRIDSEACGLCHPHQRADWSASLHRLAMSPGVIGQLDAFDLGTQQMCLDCHAPREEQQQRWQEGRLASVDELHGVDCAACHLRDHVHFGPKENAITPHGGTQRHPLFKEAEFCATCHQFDDDAIKINGKPLENTYSEWQASAYARAGITCQHCHMPDGRHLFRGIHDPEMTRRGLAVRAVRTRAGVSFRAGNLGAGHALPTYITPRILLRIKGLDSGRVKEHLIQRSMTWSAESGWEELADSRLLPGEWVVLGMPLSFHEAAVVEVIVDPDADYRERVYPALLQALSGELTSSARALLQRARDEAKRSIYVLCRMACGAWVGTETSCRTQLPGEVVSNAESRPIAATGSELGLRGCYKNEPENVIHH